MGTGHEWIANFFSCLTPLSTGHAGKWRDKLNPATEFIQELIRPGIEEFSPKHLAEFAVETLSDPHIRIQNLSMMLS